MFKSQEDTIVAIATPQGVGALGVIRVSGHKAIELVDAVFKGKNLSKVEGHTVHYGQIVREDGYIIDECLATVFRAPRSFTKEDSVEISIHGSSYILNEILQLLIRKGARLAGQGEFTLRAFLNGQFDLAQAEAIADLIASKSQADHELAMNQMRGGISDKIRALRQELIDFAALIELELDFGEEDVEFADRAKLENLVQKIKLVVDALLNSFRLGNVLKNGVATVIAGRPNAGKSTLLNALVEDERALVSDIAGTTRDTIEEIININGVMFRLIDTAGIRETQDTIEKMGVDRTLKEISRSTLVVYVFEAHKTKPDELWDDVNSFIDEHKAINKDTSKLFVANKMDLNPYVKPDSFYKEGLINNENLIPVSAKNQMNIEALKNLLYEKVIQNPEMLNETIVSNNRHYEALQKASESLRDVLGGLGSGLTGDFISIDIRKALYHLGEITGEIHTDDLLDSIFSRFCIGK
ncbi:MAG: tRNA uridine-5-carboxymethylaminomethyl(34) synthesis GTPase MnmE [Chitinophagia bacterium]|nr:tRNA uridine-5-carboxymethylaminomethyl(34) synthesis GTPase MnmE [Chitinophagia bacterium]